MRRFCVLFLSLWVAVSAAANFTHGQAARAAIGQPYFTAALDGASQTLIGAPSGLAYANDTLFVADSNRLGALPTNNRVLIYHNVTQQFPDPNIEPPNQGLRCPVCGGKADVVLGQKDFTSTDVATSQAGMQLPTAVATDGTVLAVADTNNNRVLIWKTIPASVNTPADLVVGQKDFTSSGTSVPPTANSLRGPQGVWIQHGKLYIADTQDHRVLIYNSIPASNGVAADVVLGQPNFTTFVEPDLTQAKSDATANNLLNPVSVTSDGARLFIADLGHNRVLIWNTLPTQNQQPADVAVGQPDLVSSIPNNSTVMCASNGKDSSGNLTYPSLCDQTLSFPRYALSDGNWLFIADGGNDRVTVYDHVPAKSGAVPDIILGAADGMTDNTGTGTNQLATPTSLAWDGNNLFVSDTFNRRVLIYTPASPNIPSTGVRNAASLEVFAIGSVTFAGTIHAGDVVTVTINGTGYKYTVVKNDTFANVVTTLVNSINTSNNGAGDPNVIAELDTAVAAIVLTARKGGVAGNSVTVTTTVSSGAQITATAGGATLSGGQSTAQVGPGSLITIYGTGLSDSSGADPGTGHYAPGEIANTKVYIDGNAAPLLYVSPKQINAQMPLYGADSGSVSLYVWTQHADKSVTVTTPVAVTIVPENPGIFAQSGNDPRPGVVYHGNAYANALVSVDGSIQAGDVGTITISGRKYSYTVQSSDTLTTVTNALAAAVSKDSQVKAFPAGVFTRVVLQARAAGKAGVGITYSASVNTGAKLLLTAIGPESGSNFTLCCPNTGPVTASNPAAPGETITVYATGLGLLTTPNSSYATGRRYDGPPAQPVDFVSSLAGGKTANVLEATPLTGSVGIWIVQLQLNSGLPTDPATHLTIAQSFYVSNAIAFPVKQ